MQSDVNSLLKVNLGQLTLTVYWDIEYEIILKLIVMVYFVLCFEFSTFAQN